MPLDVAEPEPARATPTGGVAQGHDEVRYLFTGLIDAGLTMHGQTTGMVCSGDVALQRFTWTLTGLGPDGSPTEQTGTAVLVFRRQPEGGWLIAVEHPFVA